MSEPAVAPGWYPDPWKQGELRWYDGNEWTSNLHGDAAPAATAAPVAGVPAPSPRNPARSGKAIASLILGVLGVPIVALVLGILALREINRSMGQLTGRWMAIVGIVLNSLQVLVIPILLAVAIPTFLAQKDVALRTQAKANLMQTVNVIESCAASNVDGSYGGCTDVAALSTNEPALAELLERCGAPGGVCVEAVEGGYVVRSRDSGSPSTTYVQTARMDGTLEKTCSGPTCPSGRW